VADDAAIVERLNQALLRVAEGGVFDSEGGAAFAAAIAPLADPDLVCLMSGGALTTQYSGLDGIQAGWTDFLSPFETLRVEFDGSVEPGREGWFVDPVRLTGVPKGSSGEIEQTGAAVWQIRDGRVVRVEFHLDRDAARRAAGIDL
jgi:hypothetical protein